MGAKKDAASDNGRRPSANEKSSKQVADENWVVRLGPSPAWPSS